MEKNTVEVGDIVVYKDEPRTCIRLLTVENTDGDYFSAFDYSADRGVCGRISHGDAFVFTKDTTIGEIMAKLRVDVRVSK